MEKNNEKFPNPGNALGDPGPEKPKRLPFREQEILKKLKNGDTDAFKKVFSRWEPLLYNYLLKLTGSPEDAQDISQDTFAKLWTNRQNIDPSKNIRTFIFLIAQQLTWNMLRTRKRNEAIFTDTVADCEDDVSFESQLNAREMEMLADYFIEKLPESTRRVYILHYKENLTHEEIASRLGITVVNVTTQIYQARKRLKNIFMLYALIFLSNFY